ncbi:MAG: O-antigen ligase family protein [Planctomycetaceae bacterium]|nr:O-antigen ligase family protein [Planctomycetaceae bacterium]
MNFLFSWLIALLVTLPIAIRVAEFADKPVDLVGSDLLFLLLVFVPRRRDLVIPRGLVLYRLSAARLAAVAMLLYCSALAAVAYAESSEMSRVVSAIKFAKPLAFLPLGVYLAGVTPSISMLRRIALAFAGMSLATLGTATVTPGFPQIAWGARLFAYPLYGYPNSAMTLFAILVPFLLAAADLCKTPMGKWSVRGIAGITSMLVLMSLSRSSSGALACGVWMYLYFTGRIYFPMFAAVSGAMLLVMFSSAFEALLGNNDVLMWVERFTRRFSQTVGAADPLSGRGGLWALTIDLWSERPLCGYAFESFSNYADFDTPHQQYLEILFKSGAVGAALYGIVLLSAWMGLVHLARFSVPTTEPWYLLRALMAAFIATMVGNISQPNLTYSVTGNFLFFSLGLALNKHTAAALVTYASRVRRPQVEQTAPHPRRIRAAA